MVSKGPSCHQKAISLLTQLQKPGKGVRGLQQGFTLLSIGRVMAEGQP